MTGYTNYTADNFLNWEAGLVAVPALAARFAGLFTAVGTDAGTGFTEVSGGSYARVQVAGSITTNAATSTSSAVIGTAASGVPAWVVNGMTVYDTTNGNVIGTVLSTSGGNSITLNANALHAITSGDSLAISAFPMGSGTGPSSVTSGAAVAFATSTADWTGAGASPVVAWGLFDALTSGNLIRWDYLGGFNWLPATVSAASPGTITAHAHGIGSGGFLVFSTEFGGVAPTFSAGNYTGILTAGGVGTDTITITGVNTSATGDGMIRQVSEQLIPNNTQFTIPAGSFVLSAA